VVDVIGDSRSPFIGKAPFAQGVNLQLVVAQPAPRAGVVWPVGHA